MNTPKHTHPHDIDWIKEQLDKLLFCGKLIDIDDICAKYDSVFEQVINDKSISEIQRDGEARRQANTRLRIYTNRMLAL